MSNVLASRLNNRVEIYKNSILKTELGDSREHIFYKKVWADIIPISANSKNLQHELENVDIKFKIIMRNIDIAVDDIIFYKGNKYEVSYIIPAFNKNNYIEVYCTLKKEYYGEL